MHWTDEANTIVEELLNGLPAPARETVRESTHERAIAITSDAGDEEVSMEVAVRAFIECTPSDLRSRLRKTLEYHGIDPEEYEEAFSS